MQGAAGIVGRCRRDLHRATGIGGLERVHDLHEARTARTREHEADANRAIELPRRSPLNRVGQTPHGRTDLRSEALARRRQRDPTAGGFPRFTFVYGKHTLVSLDALSARELEAPFVAAMRALPAKKLVDTREATMSS